MRSSPDSLRIVLTGGGTGGHISPILAVIDELTSREIDVQPFWVGSKYGIERNTARDHGIPFQPVAVGKLRRYISLRTVPDAARVPLGVVQATRLLRRFKPDVVFSTGGYVGVPAVIAGRALGVPSLTHEQTAVLGLATRINARFSNCIALSHESTSKPAVIRGGRVTVTGNPIRSELLNGNPAGGRRHFDIRTDLPVLYVTGGAQGALTINDVIGQALPELLDFVEVVHQTGPNDINGSFGNMLAIKENLPHTQQARYHPVERVGPELADLYAVTNLVFGRSGAGTVAEIGALGLPSILTPLPGATEQLENARLLVKAGAAVLILEEELTPAKLIQQLEKVTSDVAMRERMSIAAKSTAKLDDPAARLVDEILRLVH